MTVEVSANANGTEFFFPAARNKGFAAITNLFLFIFAAVTYFLFRGHIPIIFALVFGFFSLLLLYISIQMWFGTTRVVIGNGILSLQSGLLGGGKLQQFRCADIELIATKITTQQGGATGTAYYDIQLALRGRTSRITLGRTLRNKHEAGWLVVEMERLAGVQPKSVSAAMS